MSPYGNLYDATFEGADVCYAPILAMSEARHHPHHQARGSHGLHRRLAALRKNNDNKQRNIS